MLLEDLHHVFESFARLEALVLGDKRALLDHLQVKHVIEETEEHVDLRDYDEQD